MFDRYHKSPARHRMWGWQLDQWAQWCVASVMHKDIKIATRGTQIAGTLAPDSDLAVYALSVALSHKSTKVRRLAAEILWGLGKRAAAAKKELEEAAEDEDEGVQKAVRQALKNIDG